MTKSFRAVAPLFVAAIALVLMADPALALRRERGGPLFRRTAFSGYLGVGIPVGEFASERIGDGNHEAGALDWAFEVEHFFGPTFSLGFSVANTTYEDKDFASLETHLSTYAGFLRVVVPSGSSAFPYVRVGMGGVEVQFQDPTFRVDSEFAFALQVGGGVLWSLSRHVGVDTQVMYSQGSTEHAFIAETEPDPTEVGFDSKYFTFSVGVSVLVP